MSKDWIPAKDAEFDPFFKEYFRTVLKNTSGASPEWAHIPADRVTGLADAYGAWNTAWAKLKEAHTSGDVEAKDEARDAGKRELRDFNNEFILYSRYVTDAQRRDIGCPVHDKTPTTVPRPQNQPTADISYPGPHLIELDNIRSLPGGPDDPRVDYGIRIFWGIVGEPTATDKFRISAPPLTGEDLPHSTFTHRRKFRFDFDGDSGKKAWFSLRYENEKGGEKGEGPFGPLLSTIIP